MQGLSFYLKNRDVLFDVIMANCMGWLPDKAYLKMKFRHTMGHKLNLKNPKTFSEKLQWLKLYDRRPEYIVMVDKVKAKDYVASVLGEEYIIPTLGVWENPDDIDFDKLPDRFVLKCNHNSGTGMYICKDKNKMDVDKVKEELKKGIKEDYYKKNREWPYKDVPRRAFAEAYMEDEFGELRDYKFFCFNGEVKAMFIATDRSKGEHAVRFDFFDENYNHLPFTNGHPNATVQPEKPRMFEEMKVLASKLSKGIPQVRIDFFEVGNKVYFGEMTFFHWSGLQPFVPEEWDYKFGEWIKLI
jgi:hypothetical protein